jgi:hypothetical protein
LHLLRSSAVYSFVPRPVELSVSWHGGVHIEGTPLWCDARRVSDVCFVSNAFAVPAMRHGQLIATRETLALMAREHRHCLPQSQLPVPCGRPFTLGEIRLELFRSGHIVGGASLAVERGGQRVVYAGVVNPHGGGLGGQADVRRCDILVIDAAYGDPAHQFPPIAAAREQTIAFVRDTLTAGDLPVLAVTSPGKAMDVASALAVLGRPLRAHRAIHQAARKLTRAGVVVPRLRRWAGTFKDNEIILWLADSLPVPARRSRGFVPRVALISGRAGELAQRRAGAPDAAIPWSNRADHGELRRYVLATGAKHVLVTGRYSHRFAAELAGAGLSSRALGPAHQLSLF